MSLPLMAATARSTNLTFSCDIAQGSPLDVVHGPFRIPKPILRARGSPRDSPEAVFGLALPRVHGSEALQASRKGLTRPEPSASARRDSDCLRLVGLAPALSPAAYSSSPTAWRASARSR